MEDMMGVRCSICGRWFKTASGRIGHQNFYHGFAKESPFTKAIRWDIDRKKGGVKKQEEEKVENRTKREKAIAVLRGYEKSLAESEEIGFIDEIEMETDDSKFFDSVEFD